MGGPGLGSRQLQVWPDLSEFLSGRAYEPAEDLSVLVESICLVVCKADAREELLALLDVNARALHGLPPSSKQRTINAACRDEIGRGASTAKALRCERCKVKAQTRHDGSPRCAEKRWGALKQRPKVTKAETSPLEQHLSDAVIDEDVLGVPMPLGRLGVCERAGQVLAGTPDL